MSALAGLVSFDGEPAPSPHLEAMAAAMAHRGGLAAPARDASRVVSLHGRLDNREELRRALGEDGARLEGGDDAQVLLRAHAKWGADCVTRIEGDFAFALWDERTRELLCARDRLGHKPLYYATNGARFAFASEPQALLRLPWIGAAPNPDVLAEHLAGEWLNRDETLWAAVMRLPAAHRLRVSARGCARDRYWRPEPDERLGGADDDELAAIYRELLDDSVARASRGAGTVAIEVSGGLDSSAVLAVAEQLRRGGRLGASGIFAATMTTALPGADERGFAREVAAHVGVALHEVPASVLPDEVHAENARRYADFPGFPNAWMRRDLLRAASRAGCRVALTGEGGDAWLDGTRGYYAEEIARGRWRRLAQCLRADARAYGTPRALAWLLRHGLLELLVPASGRPASELPSWLAPEMRERLRARRRAAQADRPSHSARHGLQILLDDPFSAHVMESIERIAAACGVELRHPLQDARLVQLAFSLPARARLRGSRSKYLHREALGDLLPPAVRGRTTKADFSALLVAQLRPLEEELTRRLPSRRPSWVTAAGMRSLFDALERGPEVWPMWPLWAIHGCDLALPEGQSGRMAEWK